MPVLPGDSEEAGQIDQALAAWCQGDLALEERWFVHVGDPARPLTEATAELSLDDGIQAIDTEVEGLVVLTQTCDIVRTCAGTKGRPFIEVAPIVTLGDIEFREVEGGRRPAYALVPALRDRRQVADLDLVMTVEKSLVAQWTRTPGCTNDNERWSFAEALARKRERFAFPDEFGPFAKKLEERLLEKHDRLSEEGDALRALREIRVSATPGWNAAKISPFFWFIRNGSDPEFKGKSWAEYLKKWLALMPANGPFLQAEGAVFELRDLTAADYVASVPLDLDFLTSRRRVT
ncbi:MAG: hypothetical protein M0Z94_06230 [Dehalococcoidales bacterium]|nr:hypothetical protein [Dehalococcoidales bacterium]